MSDYVLHSAQCDACDIDGTHPLTEKEGKEDGNSVGEDIAYTEDEPSEPITLCRTGIPYFSRLAAWSKLRGSQQHQQVAWLLRWPGQAWKSLVACCFPNNTWLGSVFFRLWGGVLKSLHHLSIIVFPLKVNICLTCYKPLCNKNAFGLSESSLYWRLSSGKMLQWNLPVIFQTLAAQGPELQLSMFEWDTSATLGNHGDSVSPLWGAWSDNAHSRGEYPRGENGLMYMSVFMCLYPKLFPLSNVFFGEWQIYY